MGQASVQYALDPGAHALLADLALASANSQLDGVMEAFVTRLLAPQWPEAWKRWAKAQVMGRRTTMALHSLDRYFALAGAAAERDSEAVSLRADLRRKTLGGDLVREEVRRSAVSPR